MTTGTIPRTSAVWLRMARHSVRRPAFAYVIPTVFPIGLVVIISQLYQRVAVAPEYQGHTLLDWMAPGTVFVAACMGGGFTATILVGDITDGFADRLRLLPISRGEVVAGMLAFEATRQLPIGAVLLGCAAVLGMPLPGPAGLLVILALSAVWAAVWNAGFVVAASLTRSPDIALALLPAFLPFLLASSIIVPRALLPDYLDRLAGWNPLEYYVSAVRPLILDGTLAWAEMGVATAVSGLLLAGGIVAAMTTMRRTYAG